MSLFAGRDLNSASTTVQGFGQAEYSTAKSIILDRIASISVSGPGGLLDLVAGRDINLTASSVSTSGANSTIQMSAGNNLNLGTVTTGQSRAAWWNQDQNFSVSQWGDAGSLINSQGSILLSATQDIVIKAASVQAAGTLQLSAGNDINVVAGQSQSQSAIATTRTLSCGMTGYGSCTTSSRTDQSKSTVISSSLGGSSVLLTSGADINLLASNVIADQSLTMLAKGDLNINAMASSASSSRIVNQTESDYVFHSDLNTSNQSSATSYTGSTLGSIGGNITLSAGGAYSQQASSIVAPNGNVSIAGSSVLIGTQTNTSHNSSSMEQASSGITLGLSGSLYALAQNAEQMLSNVGKTSDPRMKALAIASAGMSGFSAFSSIKSIGSNEGGGAGESVSMGIQLSYGQSQSQSSGSESSKTAVGSSIDVGGSVTIQATGSQALGDLTIAGSKINAGNTVSLIAANNLNLLAAQNTTSLEGSNNSSGWSVGLNLGASSKGMGLSFTASASSAHGNYSGDGLTYTNTTITAGNQALLQSGANTSLIGASVAANQITADVGGNLTIQSLQDRSTYTSNQQSTSASISIPIYGAGSASASVSASQSRINSNYESVNQQSGLMAGNGGFNVTVAGNTSLTGAVISSSDAAVANGLNSFKTASLTLQDLKNSATYSASNQSMSLGAGLNAGQGVPNGGAGFGNTSGRDSSVTSSGISGIAGSASVRTGDGANGIAPIFNLSAVQNEVNAQAQITQAFGSQAAMLVANYADSQIKKNDAEIAGMDPDDPRISEVEANSKMWQEGGAYRVLMHAVAGGLGGGLGGALGAMTSQIAVPALGAALMDANLPASVKQSLVLAAGSAIGYASGGMNGLVAGYNDTLNNYLSHPQIQQKNKEIAECGNGNPSCIEEREQYWKLVSQLQNQVIIESCVNGTMEQCSRNIELLALNVLPGLLDIKSKEQFGVLEFSPEYRANIKEALSLLRTNLDKNHATSNWLNDTTYASPSTLAQKDLMDPFEAKLLEELQKITFTQISAAVVPAVLGAIYRVYTNYRPSSLNTPGFAEVLDSNNNVIGSTTIGEVTNAANSSAFNRSNVALYEGASKLPRSIVTGEVVEAASTLPAVRNISVNKPGEVSNLGNGFFNIASGNGFVGTNGYGINNITVIVTGPRGGVNSPVSPNATENVFATGADEAVFWSGKTNGIGGLDVACNIATRCGGTTLEQLMQTRGIALPVWDASNPSVVAAWKDVSRKFAAGASGDVKAVIGSTLRPGSVWETVELPALKENARVTSVTTVDPITGVETVIFKR